MRIVLLSVLLVACGHHHDGASSDGGDGNGDGGLGDSGGNGDSGATGDGGTPATGGLDPGFGSGGVVVVSSAGTQHAYDLAIQPDGKIVVVGDAADGMLVLRFRDDGTLDSTFGTQGRVAVGGAGAKANGVALQADGKIVLAGTNQQGAVIARLDSAGALDATFGTGGMSSVLAGLGALAANDVAIRANGTIVVCGEGEPMPYSTVHFGFVARVTATGALDTTFGTGGMSTLTAQHGGWFARLAIDGQDRILAAGTVYYDFTSGNGDMMLLGRFSSGGALDSSYANGAQYVGGVTTYARDIAVLPDGRALVAGMTADDTGETAYELGYRAATDGTRDVGFATNGEAQVRVSGMWATDGFALALQPDGAAIFVGQGDPTSPGPLEAQVIASRLTTAGASDDSFGTSGSLAFTVPGGDANPRATELAASGKLYITGFTSTETSTHTDVFLARVQ